MAYEELKNELVSMFLENVDAIYDSYTVLLTGSFSRGEQTVLLLGDKPEVLGDIEFVIFTSIKDYLSRDKRRKLFNSFGEGTLIDFNVLPISLIEHTPKTFFWYETFLTCEVVGEKKSSITLPKFKSKQLDIGDVNEIINHRLISNLQVFQKILSNENDSGDYLHMVYKINKNILDLLIPYLTNRGVVAVTHGERVRLFLERFSSDFNSRVIARAYDMKMNIDKYFERKCSKKEVLEAQSDFIAFLMLLLGDLYQKKHLSTKDVYGLGQNFKFGEKGINRYLHLARRSCKTPSRSMVFFSFDYPVRIMRLNISCNMLMYNILNGDDYSAEVKVLNSLMFDVKSLKAISSTDAAIDIVSSILSENTNLYRYLK